jgi:hypothetical protein
VARLGLATNKMNKLIYLFILATLTANAEDYETGGGYDYKAVEAEAQAKNLAIQKQKAKSIQVRKAKQQALAKKKIADEILPENIVKFKDHEICTKAGTTVGKPNYQAWINELKRRNIRFDATSIQNQEIQINGFECDVFAVFGPPKRYNRSVNAQGTRVQFVYNRTYIYTNNGVITSWQD